MDRGICVIVRRDPGIEDVHARSHVFLRIAGNHREAMMLGRRATIPSRRDVAHGWGGALRLDLPVRRRLNCVDQCLPAIASLEPAELLRGDYDDFITPVYRDVLRSLAADLPY